MKNRDLIDRLFIFFFLVMLFLFSIESTFKEFVSFFGLDFLSDLKFEKKAIFVVVGSIIFFLFTLMQYSIFAMWEGIFYKKPRYKIIIFNGFYVTNITLILFLITQGLFFYTSQIKFVLYFVITSFYCVFLFTYFSNTLRLTKLRVFMLLILSYLSLILIIYLYSLI